MISRKPVARLVQLAVSALLMATPLAARADERIHVLPAHVEDIRAFDRMLESQPARAQLAKNGFGHGVAAEARKLSDERAADLKNYRNFGQWVLNQKDPQSPGSPAADRPIGSGGGNSQSNGDAAGSRGQGSASGGSSGSGSKANGIGRR